jgi:hypothetical protein
MKPMTRLLSTGTVFAAACSLVAIWPFQPLSAEPTSSLLTPSRQRPSHEPAKVTPHAAARSCAEYGAGFVRVEGSDSCVRIGGSISVGTGGRIGR